MSGYAWVTLATNDSYSLGALVLAHSLKQVGTAHQLVVLVTPGVTSVMRKNLADVFNLVEEVDLFDSKDETNLRLLKRPELGVTFTKLHCWRLTQFEKCVFLDADVLVLVNSDELFERDELSAAPDVGWPDCFNSGVFVYRPSLETYSKLVDFAIQKGSFDGGDQGLLNAFFSDWAHKDISKHLPFIYNMSSTATYSYMPAFKQYGANAKIVHFIGASKPWLQYFDTESRQVHPSPDLQHLKDALQRWWDVFCSMIHPTLSPDMSGLAGAFAQFQLGVKRSPSQDALENHLRKQAWEVGNIDYMGRDSFDNIWSKICQTLSTTQLETAPDKDGAVSSDTQQVPELTKDTKGEIQESQVETSSQVAPPEQVESPKPDTKTEVAEVPHIPKEEAPIAEATPQENVEIKQEVKTADTATEAVKIDDKPKEESIPQQCVEIKPEEVKTADTVTEAVKIDDKPKETSIPQECVVIKPEEVKTADTLTEAVKIDDKSKEQAVVLTESVVQIEEKSAETTEAKKSEETSMEVILPESTIQPPKADDKSSEKLELVETKLEVKSEPSITTEEILKPQDVPSETICQEKEQKPLETESKSEDIAITEVQKEIPAVPETVAEVETKIADTVVETKEIEPKKESKDEVLSVSPASVECSKADEAISVVPAKLEAKTEVKPEEVVETKEQTTEIKSDPAKGVQEIMQPPVEETKIESFKTETAPQTQTPVEKKEDTVETKLEPKSSEVISKIEETSKTESLPQTQTSIEKIEDTVKAKLEPTPAKVISKIEEVSKTDSPPQTQTSVEKKEVTVKSKLEPKPAKVISKTAGVSKTEPPSQTVTPVKEKKDVVEVKLETKPEEVPAKTEESTAPETVAEASAQVPKSDPKPKEVKKKVKKVKKVVKADPTGESSDASKK